MSEPNSSHTRWCVEIYRVSDGDRQQRILSAFREIDRPDVIALGTQSGLDWFIIFELPGVADRIHAHRVIFSVDAHARRTFSTASSQLSSPTLV